MDPTPQPSLSGDLHEGFRAFVDASRRLERSYAELKQRAAAIDLELASTNSALQQALGEKDTILGALPVGVVAVDAAGDVSWSNPEGERLMGHAEGAAVDLARAPIGECEVDGLCLAVRRATLPDGGTLMVVEDRSQVARLSREVDRLDRLAGLSELALGIAHEIKNPLNGVMGFAALLDRSEDPDEIRRYAAKIRGGLGQVDDIVREMLAFARSPEKNGALAPLAAVIDEAASAAGVPRSCIDLHGDVELEVESAALTRVLANLFRNSAEAAESHTAIRVRASATDERIELRVEDDGPGIDPALRGRVLEPFVSSKDRGHGLGLALASRVMSFLGGSLELSNSEGPGASFRLTLPRAPTDD